MRVLIVDDEVTAIKRITAMQIWMKGPYTLIGSARNGIEALDVLVSDSVDVVITDIEMPRMNGLELIRIIREKEIPVAVIILSCHESFTYAKRAISLGVDDYLIKDFLEEDILEQALQRIALASEQRPQKQGHRTLNYYEPCSRCAELLTSGSEEISSDLHKELFFSIQSLLITIIHIDCYNDMKSPFTESFECIEEVSSSLMTILDSGDSSGCVNYLGQGDFFLLHGIEQYKTEEEIHNALLWIIDDSKCSDKQSLTITWDSLLQASDNLRARFEQLRTLSWFRPYLGNGRIIRPVHTQSLSFIDSKLLEQKIMRLYILGNQCDIDGILQLILELYRQYLPGMIQFNFIQYLNSHVLTVLLQVIKSEGYDMFELYGRSYLPLQELNELDTTQALFEWFERKFRRIRTMRSENDFPTVLNPRVQKALEIIKKQYSNDELSLAYIAEQVGVHKGYLSRVFKQEVQITCYDHLQKYRIDCSKHLLVDQKLKVYEIAEMTGFNSYDQFCTVFRKYTGLSPSHYRKTQL